MILMPSNCVFYSVGTDLFGSSNGMGEMLLCLKPEDDVAFISSIPTAIPVSEEIAATLISEGACVAFCPDTLVQLKSEKPLCM